MPFVFVMDPQGIGLLLHVPKGGSYWDIAYISVTTTIGIFALGAAAQCWLLGRLNLIERALLMGGGLLMVFSTLMGALYELITPWHLRYADAFGALFIVVAVGSQWARTRLPGTAQP